MADLAPAELISAEAFEKLRTLDDLVRDEARRIHAEHTQGSFVGAQDYRRFAREGAYDDDSHVVALRAAIRRGIEIGRAS